MTKALIKIKIEYINNKFIAENSNENYNSIAMNNDKNTIKYE